MTYPHDIARVRRVIDETPEGRWNFEKAGDSNCGDGCCTEYWDDRVWCDGRVILENSVNDEGVTAFVATFDRDVAEAVVDLLSMVDGQDLPDDVKAQVELIGSMLARNVSQPFFSDDPVHVKVLANDVSEYE